MKLSIITINYNNAEGLRKTLASVAAQTYRDIEHIVIDGGSSDHSVDVIREYEQQLHLTHSTIHLLWSSENDKGIYNAMNKGIEIALGRRVVNSFNRSELVEDKSKALPDYIQILNGGDILADSDVLERIVGELEANDYPDLLFGNSVDIDSKGRRYAQGPDAEYSLLHLYYATYPHETTYFRRELFTCYGLYDDNLKIASDWKWFLQVVGLGHIKPVYVDIDVIIFDTHGIGSTNRALGKKERRQVLEELLPPAVLADYDAHAFEIIQMTRLRHHHLYWLVYLIERVLYKLERWHILHN